jgi:hypothetical protein
MPDPTTDDTHIPPHLRTPVLVVNSGGGHGHIPLADLVAAGIFPDPDPAATAAWGDGHRPAAATVTIPADLATALLQWCRDTGEHIGRPWAPLVDILADPTATTTPSAVFDEIGYTIAGRRGAEQCCDEACNGGACETCRCCAAGWCVTGYDGIPEHADDLDGWMGVAAEHNPVVAAWKRDRDERDTLRALLRDVVAHWDDKARTLPAVTEDTWRSEGDRLGRAARALKDRVRAAVGQSEEAAGA